ncbi:MAG: histidinol dehydrogenase, partial [Candidatus Paceibacterota bacterium]
PKVYKVFGPGNQYVTAAKMLVSIDDQGCAIDMPAGPSEVLVIADKNADAAFVAADLLSQAEHGEDSQAVLVCVDESKADEILAEIDKQLSELSRAEIAKAALEKSFAIICGSISEMFEFSNMYAPEHLIINIQNPEMYLKNVINAGSVFIGKYSCESAGDYASGTNHTLPTYGYAKAFSGISLDSFVKKITFQKLDSEGVKSLAKTVMTMAGIEKLDAHKRAMEVRFKTLTK